MNLLRYKLLEGIHIFYTVWVLSSLLSRQLLLLQAYGSPGCFLPSFFLHAAYLHHESFQNQYEDGMPWLSPPSLRTRVIFFILPLFNKIRKCEYAYAENFLSSYV